MGFRIFSIILLSSYRLIKNGTLKYFILLSLSSFLLLITHNLMSMIFFPIVGIWALFWLFAEKKWSNLSKLAGSIMLGLGLSAFYILPVLFERNYVHIDSILSGYFDYRRHFVNLYRLFISHHWGYGSSGIDQDNDLTLSTGLVQWLVGLLAVVLAAINFKKEKKLASLTFLLGGIELLVLFMMHQKSSFIWVQIGILKWLQFPWRFMSDSIFLLSILGGLSVYFLKKINYLFGLIVILLAFLLYFTFFQPKSWLDISDQDKFSGASWEKELTISIFDYLPIYAYLPPWQKAPELPEVLEGQAKFTDYKKGSNYQTGKVEVVGDALIRVPLYDFPGMKVIVDGQEVSHWNNDCRDQRYCLGLITFRIPQGVHDVSVKLTNTPVRTLGDLLSLSGLIILTGFIFGKIKNRKTSHSRKPLVELR